MLMMMLMMLMILMLDDFLVAIRIVSYFYIFLLVDLFPEIKSLLKLVEN